jgi:hypothetical protein
MKASAVCYGLVAMLAVTTIAQADEAEGSWKLISRKLQDGKVFTPPAIVGSEIYHNGQRQLLVNGRTPDGTLWSFSILSDYKLTKDEYQETVILSVYDHGDGKVPDYDISGSSKSSPVKREGSRVEYRLPFELVTVAFEGDTLTASMPGVFVDVWKRQ